MDSQSGSGGGSGMFASDSCSRLISFALAEELGASPLPEERLSVMIKSTTKSTHVCCTVLSQEDGIMPELIHA